MTDLRASLAGLALDGTIHQPGDAAYDIHRTAWNRLFEHRPAAIVRAASASDVVSAVRLASQHGLRVAVQTTGHGVVCPADEKSLLLVLNALASVTVDPASRTATVGGGATWAPVLDAAQDHGLAPLLGSAPHVGVVGYSLGGGSGWLARRYGLAVDQVRRLSVVLADGSLMHASATEHPDLFWAMLGAGTGSLGVVVEMQIGLVPVTDVYAGSLLYPVDMATETFDFYLDWTRGVGDEMTSAYNITAFPPLDAVPQPLRGRSFVVVRGCHCGRPDEAAALIDLWRRWRRPVHDMFAVMPFRNVAAISNDPVDPLPAATTGRWLARADRSTVDAMHDAVLHGAQPSPVLFTELRHAGGAVARENPHASFAARSAQFVLEAVALTPSHEAERDAADRYTVLWNRLADQIAPLGGYLNFVAGEERLSQLHAAFDPDTLRRLAAIKRAVDPEDLFAHGLRLAA